MPRDELYKKLGLRLQQVSEDAGVLETLPEGVERVFDPSMWIGIITALVEIFRGCRSPETAKANIRDGGVASYRAFLQVGRREKGYKGRELRDWAWKATQEARTLTDEEIDGIVNDSNDLPTPPPVDGGFWPMWAILPLLLFPSMAFAQTTDFWPMDTVQNGRLDKHDAAIDRVRHDLRTIESRVARIETDRRQPATPTEPTTSRPRSPRIVMLRTTWDKTSRESLVDWRAWLESSGWEINESDRAHMQLIDVDQDAGAMQRFKVTTLPTLIALDGDRETRRHEGRASRTEITGLVATTSDAAASPTPQSEIDRVLSLLPRPDVAFVEFGSGPYAPWCIAAATKWKCRCVGIELDAALASISRERLKASGLDHLVTIITGDATQVDAQADVGVAYLYSETLAKMRPRIEKMKAFASYMHQPPGLNTVRNGDTYFYWGYSRPAAQQQQVVFQSRGAVWGGQCYSHPQCNNPRCSMCNSIRAQLSAQPVMQASGSGHWVKRCQNGRCWMEWVPN